MGDERAAASFGCFAEVFSGGWWKTPPQDHFEALLSYIIAVQMIAANDSRGMKGALVAER